LVGGNLTQLLLSQTNVTDNNRTGTLPEQENNTNDNLISIEGVLKPALVREYENDNRSRAVLFYKLKHFLIRKPNNSPLIAMSPFTPLGRKTGIILSPENVEVKMKGEDADDPDEMRDIGDVDDITTKYQPGEK